MLLDEPSSKTSFKKIHNITMPILWIIHCNYVENCDFYLFFFLTQVEAVAPACRETLLELWMQCFPLKPAANICFSCPALYFRRASLKKRQDVANISYNNNNLKKNNNTWAVSSCHKLILSFILVLFWTLSAGTASFPGTEPCHLLNRLFPEFRLFKLHCLLANSDKRKKNYSA